MPGRRRKLLILTVFGLIVLLLIVLASMFTYVWILADPPNYTRIEPRLYVGGNVTSPPWGTDAVLNLCRSKDPYQCQVHVWEPIKDGSPAPDVEWLRKQVQFIDTNLRAGHTVYVHCRNGVSRSGMVITAYLMKKHGISRDEALVMIRGKRPIIRPNPAFMDLLFNWEKSLR